MLQLICIFYQNQNGKFVTQPRLSDKRKQDECRCGEGKRRNEFAEWHVAWLAEWHNYAEFNIRRSFSKK